MANYKEFKTSIVIDTESDLYKRIENYAEAMGFTLQQAVDAVVETGLYHHMMQQLEFRERIAKKS